MREEIATGAAATIAIRILVDGVPSVGTATTRIQRASDGKWLDTDDTFKSFSSILFAFDRALVADANDLGRYVYPWNTGAITNVTAGDVYFATIDVTAPYAFTTTGEISTALVRHGDTSWITAVVAGLSTLTASQAADAVWDALTSAHATAGSFAAFIKALPASSAIATAVWAVADGSSTMGAALRNVRRWTTWSAGQPVKKTLTVDGLHVDVTADDGTTIVDHVPVASLGATAVAPSAGESVTIG